MGKVTNIFIVLIGMFFLTSCTLFGSKEKAFSEGNFNITLDSSFQKTEQIGTNLALMSNKYVVVMTQNDQMESIEQAAELIKNNFSVPLTFNEIKGENSTFLYTCYENTGSDKIKYAYMSSIHQFDGIIYIVDIGMRASDYDEKQQEKFLKWSNTISFAKPEISI